MLLSSSLEGSVSLSHAIHLDPSNVIQVSEVPNLRLSPE